MLQYFNDYDYLLLYKYTFILNTIIYVLYLLIFARAAPLFESRALVILATPDIHYYIRIALLFYICGYSGWQEHYARIFRSVFYLNCTKGCFHLYVILVYEYN